LKSTPCGAVKQFLVICGCNHHDVRRQLVDLEQQRTHDALNLACLMHVTAFFPDDIKFIKKDNAPLGSNDGKQLGESNRCLAQKTADDVLVPNQVEGQGQFERYRVR
jgi:hypothetical protein